MAGISFKINYRLPVRWLAESKLAVHGIYDREIPAGGATQIRHVIYSFRVNIHFCHGGKSLLQIRLSRKE